MKNFFKSIVIQMISIVAAVSGLVTIICLGGLLFVEVSDVIYILLFAVPVLISSSLFLYYKKITWEEFFSALWPGLVPW